MSGPNWVLLARLVRPQGRKGEIIAEIFTDFPDRFRERPRVFLRKSDAAEPSREALIEKHWLHQGRIVLKLHGIDSINDAETLRGMEVVVPPEERVPLEDGAIYIGDLIGCRVLDESSGRDAGEIVDVERGLGAAPDLLVVQASDQRRDIVSVPAKKRVDPLLIPFAKSYLLSIDLPGRQVRMRLPEGLLDLNSGTHDSIKEQESEG